MPPPIFEDNKLMLLARMMDLIEMSTRNAQELASNDLLECAAGSTTNASIHSHKLNTVPRLAFVDQVVIEDDICTARQLTRRRALWHLLDADSLVIPELTVAKLCLHIVIVVIFLGNEGCRRREIGNRSGRITVLLGQELLCRRAIMYRLHDLRPDE